MWLLLVKGYTEKSTQGSEIFSEICFLILKLRKTQLSKRKSFAFCDLYSARWPVECTCLFLVFRPGATKFFVRCTGCCLCCHVVKAYITRLLEQKMSQRWLKKGIPLFTNSSSDVNNNMSKWRVRVCWAGVRDSLMYRSLVCSSFISALLFCRIYVILN